MKKILLLAGLIFLIFPLKGMAAWSGKYSIKSVKATSGGVEVVLSGFTNNSTEVVCTHNSFVIGNSNSNYQVKTSFVLSAYMAKEPINISYYSCRSNGQIEAGSILFQ
ncbi:hypothetical protein R1T43_01365 [Alteromonas sp. CI.11.F.A3]|uniref:hypothetical protein n=1 Tax=Alteromonas sp. CI.11.F.A3 TaxID=3079555 RepID=UPI0029422C39|nr:hypothetical protein [Alteromonas sp. CI.11.F.A3]WOI37715.1 hypothetical protein R1T43_01365 [Alteromonas sp. CI.11.F.A3]